MSDEEFIARFENGTLPPDSFHHREHVKMAFLYLCRYPVLEALERFATALKQHSIRKGTPERYNETVTWAFVFLIRERMARHAAQQTWDEFSSNNPDLLNWQNSILKNYYRDETLSSNLAKQTFLFPDKTMRQTNAA